VASAIGGGEKKHKLGHQKKKELTPQNPGVNLHHPEWQRTKLSKKKKTRTTRTTLSKLSLTEAVGGMQGNSDSGKRHLPKALASKFLVKGVANRQANRLITVYRGEAKMGGRGGDRPLGNSKKKKTPAPGQVNVNSQRRTRHANYEATNGEKNRSGGGLWFVKKQQHPQGEKHGVEKKKETVKESRTNVTGY